MPRGRMPTLRDTGRRYVEGTARARLQSPGVERYASERRGAGRTAAIAAALVAALVGAMLLIWSLR
jgi:hypothetical protein